MDKSDKALEYFRNKFNCSQSVFTPFGIDQGLQEDDCLRLSCSFGAGMGRQQLTCGAVTGALMAIGLKYGKATKIFRFASSLRQGGPSSLSYRG